MDTARTAFHRFGSPLVGVVFSAVALVPDVLAGSQLPLLSVASIVLLGGVIALSAWFPRTALGIAIALVAVQIGFPFAFSEARDWPLYYGPAFIVFFIGLNPCPKVRLQGLGAAVLLAVIATLLFGTRVMQARGEVSVPYWGSVATQFAVLMVGAWLVGFGLRMTVERSTLVRERAMTAETMRQAELKLAVAGERDRISRELHDVLAHSLAVIAAQADGSRYLSSNQPAVVTMALENISGTARSALIDAQRVIANVADDANTDAPGLNDVDTLIARMRHGHLDIDRTDQGDRRPLSSDQELTVYRIVQESLTNALKHAGVGSAATVRFNWDGPGLTLHMTSTPRTPRGTDDTPRQGGGGGRGINGLRDRVEATGGWLRAEQDDTAFITTAFIPYTIQPLESSAHSVSHATHD